jgi:hypothetical protein
MKPIVRLSAADAIDRLYAGPLESFVALRRELAGELRADGDIAGSREVAAAKKPSRRTWALNQVARRHPESLKAVMDAHAAAVAAHAHGDAMSVRETARGFREALAEVVKQSAELVAAANARMTAALAREMSETVRAALAGDPETRKLLFAGRLADDIDADEPFAGVEVGTADGEKSAAPSKEAQRRSAAAHDRERQRAQREHDLAIEAARRRLAALEQEAALARDAAKQTEIAAKRAQADADRARRALDVLNERLNAARRELEGVTK